MGGGGTVDGAGIASVGGGGSVDGATGMFASVGVAAGAGTVVEAGVGSVADVGSVAGVGNGVSTVAGAAAIDARSVSEDGMVSLISTGVPAPSADATCNTLQLVRRMQPCDWVLEMREGSGVP